MARPFVLTEAVRKEIAAVKKYAEDHRVSLHDCVESMGSDERSFGNDPRRKIEIPVDFVAVYTIEEQPIGPCHHLSLRVLAEGRLPHPLAMKMLMEELGIMTPIEECYAVWKSDHDSAIHILAKI